jgi:hypothetical protein
LTRKPRLQRLSRLFTFEVHFPKLDVAGSNPVSRSMFSIAYRNSHPERSLLFEVTWYTQTRNVLIRKRLNE